MGRAGAALLLAVAGGLAGCGSGGSADAPVVETPAEAPLAAITVRPLQASDVGTLASGQQAVMSELLVTTRDGVMPQAATDLFTRLGFTVVGQVPEAGLYQLALPAPLAEPELAAKREQLAALPEVQTAALNLLMRDTAALVPNDTNYKTEQAWATRLINAEQAWQKLKDLRNDGTSFTPVRVGIVDSGFVRGPDIGFARLYGADGIESDASAVPDPLAFAYPAGNPPSDADLGRYKDAKNHRDHGMHVAGIIGARGDNDRLIAGVAWPVTPGLYAAKHDKSGAVILAHVARLVRDDARVLNLSFGYDLPTAVLQTGTPETQDFSRTFARLAVSLLARKDFLIVNAAGNEGADTRHTTYFGRAFEDCEAFFGFSPDQCIRLRDHTLIVAGTSSKLPAHLPFTDVVAPPLTPGASKSNTSMGASNYGAAVGIAAPGGDPACRLMASATEPVMYEQNRPPNIMTCDDKGVASLGADGGRVLMHGTSQATPFVSGAAAVLLSVNPALTMAQVKELLVSNVSSHSLDTLKRKIPFLDLDLALTAALTASRVTPPAPDTSQATFLFTLTCRSTQADGTTARTPMREVPIGLYKRDSGVYALLRTLSTDMSGSWVTDLPKGTYFLRADATEVTPALEARYFNIDPALGNGIRVMSLTFEPPGGSDCAKVGTDIPLAESKSDDSPLADWSAVPDGIFGDLGDWNSACAPGATDCTVFADVILTSITSTAWSQDTWRSTARGPFTRLAASASDRWALTATGWAREIRGGAVTTGADGLSRILMGGVPTTVVARLQDLAGLPLSYPSAIGTAQQPRFGAGAIAYTWQMTTTDDAYRLFQPVNRNDGGTTTNPGTLAGLAADYTTPAGATTPGRTVGWNGLEVSFDGPLQPAGTVTTWSLRTGLPTGQGRYRQRVVNGQTVLVVEDVDGAAIADAMPEHPELAATYGQGQRLLLATVGGLVYQGLYQPAGTYTPERPSLNRTAIDTVLVSRGLCKLPAADGTSDCSAAAAVPAVTGIQFVAGTLARLEVTFNQPMSPTYFTTGSYIPQSSVWETTTKFVVTFTSYSPGGVIDLVAPTPTDPRGFRAATGVPMAGTVRFQFPQAP